MTRLTGRTSTGPVLTGQSAALDFAPPEPLDMASGKYVRRWQGPQHPGITGTLSLDVTGTDTGW
jgi:hypothetical protein